MRTLRERLRHSTMREVQFAALDMFLQKDFDSVSVEDIALNAGVSVSTVYRLFKTKEQIVLWDEFDNEVDEQITDQLVNRSDGLSPFSTIRCAFVEVIGRHYQKDMAFHLPRIKLILSTPRIYGAAAESELRIRQNMAQALAPVLSKKHKDAAAVLAGAALLALDIALMKWVELNGEANLDTLIDHSFEQLSGIESIR